jgi:hypothetical protein
MEMPYIFLQNKYSISLSLGKRTIYSGTAESWVQAHVSITWEVGLFNRDP